MAENRAVEKAPSRDQSPDSVAIRVFVILKSDSRKSSAGVRGTSFSDPMPPNELRVRVT